MQIVRNRYDFSRVQMAKVNRDAVVGNTAHTPGPSAAATTEVAQPSHVMLQSHGVPPIVAIAEGTALTAVAAPTSPSVAVGTASPKVPSPAPADTGAGISMSPPGSGAPPSQGSLVESKTVPMVEGIKPSASSESVSGVPTTTATAAAPAPSATDALVLDAPDIEAIAKERYTLERAMAEGLLPTPKHGHHHKQSSTASSFASTPSGAAAVTTPSGKPTAATAAKIRSHTRMPASDSSIVTFLNAADVSQVISQGRPVIRTGTCRGL
jgi:hypothetical protein